MKYPRKTLKMLVIGEGDAPLISGTGYETPKLLRASGGRKL
jgi:hypothetical protein